MSHVLSFTLEINNFPCLTNFSCRYIHHIRSHAVSGELPIDISGISSHLIGIFGTNDLQGLYHGSVFRLEILELHHPAIVVEGGARYARQYQIRTAAWQVLLHGEGIAVAQVTTQYLVERATNKVLVDLVEYLRRELAEIFLEIIFHKRRLPDFESCSHLAFPCLLWSVTAALETAKALVLQRILDAPTGIDQLHIRKNQSSN